MWIADVFGRDRAERITFDEVSSLFYRIPEMDLLERLDHHLVLGAKGCGKSTAFRALTFRAWCQRAAPAAPSFCGIYLPMGDDDITVFRTAFRERQLTDVFEHFLLSTLFYHATSQLQGALPEPLEIALGRILADHLRPGPDLTLQPSLRSLRPLFLNDRHATLREIRRDPGTSLSSISDLQTQRLTIPSLAAIAERFATAAADFAGVPTHLALLIDSFDYYGSLATVIAPLLQSDSGIPLLIKAAARTLPVDEIVLSPSGRPLEPERDFHILSLDRDSDDDEHVNLVKGAVCRRARLWGPPASSDLSDEEIITILFGDSPPASPDLASFAAFCAFSSGNLLTVVLLLDKAAQLQRAASARSPTNLDPLRGEFRLRSVRDFAATFADFELGARLAGDKNAARVFCDVALEMASAENPADKGSPLFTLLGASEPNRPLLSRMLATRVLTATELTLNTRAQAGFNIVGEVGFEINRAFVVACGRLPLRGKAIHLDRKRFGQRFRKALQQSRHHLAPRGALGQQDLFPPDFCVFLSMPFTPAKYRRTSIVRKTLNRLWREATGREAGPGRAYVDISYIPHVGPFRQDLPNYIRDSTYVVADVTDLGISDTQSAGVFYEIGLAVGSCKPLALFYNSRDAVPAPQPFRSGSLPAILRGQTVIVWSPAKRNFYEEFRPVHERLRGFFGKLKHPLDVVPAATGVPAVTPGCVYLSFQPRHLEAERWFVRRIEERFPEVAIIRSKNWAADDVPAMWAMLSTAGLAIIDCTEGVNEKALELGMRSAVTAERTLEVWNGNRDRGLNPVSMFPGQRYRWQSLGEADRTEVQQMLERISATADWGRRRL